MSIYKTQRAKTTIGQITERLLAKLPEKGKAQTVQTSYGDTHCLEFFKPDKPKLVIFHGGYTNHAFILYYLRFLIGEFHIYAFDLPGHPGKSCETILNPTDNSYGLWACEAMENIGLKKAHLLGLSYGGFVSQRIAAIKPHLAASLTLIVPAGIASMNHLSLFKNLMLPQLMFRITRSERFLMQMIDALFTDYDDSLIIDFFREMLLHVKNDSRQMLLSKPEEFAHFDKPVFVICAENDVVFDCNQLKTKAMLLFKNIEIELLKSQKHSPSVKESAKKEVCTKVQSFILNQSKPA